MNHRTLSNYLGEDLYKYFVEKRGIDAKNEDMCLVVGWTKANSWGMAASRIPILRHTHAL